MLLKYRAFPLHRSMYICNFVQINPLDISNILKGTIGGQRATKNMKTILALTVLAGAYLIGMALYARHMRHKHHSRSCPRCGHYPCRPHVTGLVYKGTGGMPVYDYKCPKCGYEFTNRFY